MSQAWAQSGKFNAILLMFYLPDLAYYRSGLMFQHRHETFDEIPISIYDGFVA